MNLIDELDGRLVNLWKFSSVWFSTVSGACSAAVAAYEGFKTVDPASVRWVPEQIIGMLVSAAVLFTFASIIARGVPQPKLRDRDSGNNSEQA